MTNQGAKKLLDISTLEPDRLSIGIDGRLYYLRAREDFGLRELVKLQALYSQILTQSSNAEPDEETIEELSAALDKFCRLLIMDCPDEIHDKMQDQHRLAIAQAFTLAIGAESPTPNRATRRAKKSTSERQYQDSKDSMAAVRKTG